MSALGNREFFQDGQPVRVARQKVETCLSGIYHDGLAKTSEMDFLAPIGMHSSVLRLQSMVGNRAAAASVVQRAGSAPPESVSLDEQAVGSALADFGQFSESSVGSLRSVLGLSRGGVDSALVHRLAQWQRGHGLPVSGKVDRATGRYVVLTLNTAKRHSEAIQFVIDLFDIPFDADRFAIGVDPKMPERVGFNTIGVTYCMGLSNENMRHLDLGSGHPGAENQVQPKSGGIININPNIVPDLNCEFTYELFVHNIAHEAFHASSWCACCSNPEDRSLEKLAAEEFEAYYGSIFPSRDLPILPLSRRSDVIDIAFAMFEKIPETDRTPRQRFMYDQLLSAKFLVKYEMVCQPRGPFSQVGDLLHFTDKDRLETAQSAIEVYERLPDDMRTPDLTDKREQLNRLVLNGGRGDVRPEED